MNAVRWFLQTPWPIPALGLWALAWVLFLTLRVLHVDVALAWMAALFTGLLAAVLMPTWVRRGMVALGFPLSWWLLTGGEGSRWLMTLPAWGWLVPLAGLLLLYPPGSWRDAPLFPTPSAAFDGLAQPVPLPLAGHVLDAGCGVGDGLLALERAYPEVHLHGIERSWPLRLVCALRVPTAKVRQGDIWAADWAAYDMVYLFQRPESMPRAWQQAQAQLKPGAWLASLEFAVPDVPPTQVWTCPDGRPLWLYQKA